MLAILIGVITIIIIIINNIIMIILIIIHSIIDIYIKYNMDNNI